jgi:hypothetical protein
VLGSFFGRAIVAAVRSVGAVAVNAALAELRKPETQAKIGAGIATAQHHLNDPEKRAELERAAGTAGKTAARMLGRAAGSLRNKIGGDGPT